MCGGALRSYMLDKDAEPGAVAGGDSAVSLREASDDGKKKNVSGNAGRSDHVRSGHRSR